jgi:hypothetical protein
MHVNLFKQIYAQQLRTRWLKPYVEVRYRHILEHCSLVRGSLERPDWLGVKTTRVYLVGGLEHFLIFPYWK